MSESSTGQALGARRALQRERDIVYFETDSIQLAQPMRQHWRDSLGLAKVRPPSKPIMVPPPRGSFFLELLDAVFGRLLPQARPVQTVFNQIV